MNGNCIIILVTPKKELDPICEFRVAESMSLNIEILIHPIFGKYYQILLFHNSRIISNREEAYIEALDLADEIIDDGGIISPEIYFLLLSTSFPKVSKEEESKIIDTFRRLTIFDIVY